MTRSSKTFNRKHCKPFLVLPSIADRYSADKIEEPVKMPLKNPAGLKLFTKRTNIKKREDRPLTATLEKPMILDIRFIGLIDMSKIRKEFLNIPNLCKMPLLINKKPVKVARPLSLPPAQRFKTKRKADSDSTENLEDNANLRSTPSKAVATIRPVAVAPIFRSAKTSSAAIKKQPTAIQPQSPHRHRDANNNDNNKPPCKIVAAIRPRKQTVPGAAKIEATSSSAPAKLASNAVAEACRTCGRKDQPERFHSHPATAVPLCGKVVSPRLAMKSTVQKPVAMKYKSKSNTNSPMEMKRQGNSRLPQPTAKLKPPFQPQNPVVRTKSPEPKRATSAKRTLTCYICGREFGSASLPLHEPKCLQKWERENASLPAHLRRKVPPKPNPNISKDEWNKLAWESSQSTLMPCHNCGRTFYPERLIVHERSCKVPQITMKNIPSTDATSSRVVDSTSSTPTTPKVPPTFECYICGKKFGSHSIKIHEKQCLKKWHIENDSLPVDMRSPPPVKKEKTSPVSPKKETVEVKKNSEDRPASSKKPPMFPCYICGRLFTVNSIYIHEPQCLKMWKIENEKLPPTKRKPEPLKPDIKFTPTYTDSEGEEEPEEEQQESGETSEPSKTPPMGSNSEKSNESSRPASPAHTQTQIKVTTKVANLVSYLDDTVVSDEGETEEVPHEVIMMTDDKKQEEQETVDEDGVTLPPEPPGHCSAELQDKITKLYEKMQTQNLDMNLLIQKRKDFRNPSIYEKLIQFCDLNELGTNYPPSIYDPLKWDKESFYEELAKVQKHEMDRREKDKRAKMEVLSGTKKAEDDKKRKSKWDQPGGGGASVTTIKPAGVIQPALTSSVTGTKGTVISAFGSLPKKLRP